MQKSKYEYHRDKGKFFFVEHENNEDKSHFHRNMEILYVLDGELRATVNDTEIIFSRDEIMHTPSFMSHAVNTPNYCKTLVLIVPYAFSSSFRKYFEEKKLPVCLNDKDFNRKSVLPLLEIYRCYFSENYGFIYNELLIKGFLNSLFGILLSRYKTIPQYKSNYTTIAAVLEYIENNYRDDLTLDVLAKAFSYNREYLSRLFNKSLNISLPQYINQVRIQNMINAVTEGSHSSMLSLAMDYGFNSLATFYRAFNDMFQTNPKTYFENIIRK